MKNKIILLSILFLLINILPNKTYADYLLSARQISLAGASGSSEQVEAGLLIYNPALLNNIFKPDLEINYITQFNLSDIKTFSCAVAYPIEEYPFNIGISYQRTDFNILVQNLYVLTTSRKINNILYGINFKNLTVENESTYSLDFAGIYSFDNKSIYLICTDLIKQNNNNSLQNITAGMSVVALKTVQFNADYKFYYDNINENEFIISQENIFFNRIYLRSGCQVNSSRYSFGIGVRFTDVSLNYGIITHPVLDNSHALSLSLRY